MISPRRTRNLSMGESRNALFSLAGLPARLRALPWDIVLAVCAIGMIGVAMLYSAGLGSWDPWAGEHLLRLVAGLVIMTIVAWIPIRQHRRFALLGWGFVVLLLLAVEFTGVGAGARRWLRVGGITIQPSEFAKLAVVVVLAAWFAAQNAESVRRLRNYVPVLAAVLIPVALVMAQPDLGTALLILGSVAAMVFVAGIPRRMIITVGVLTVVAIPVAWTQLYEYQKNRIRVFLSPESDALGTGYQIIQSKIALGSGGFFGKGYLQGSQSRLNYLPEKQTDFVFTMIGEEFGLLGCFLVMALYAYIIFRILLVGQRLHSYFARLLVLGIGIMLFFYVCVNIAMVTGMLPVVGAPLPLISYGGTAVLTIFIALGLVFSACLYDQRT